MADPNYKDNDVRRKYLKDSPGVMSKDKLLEDTRKLLKQLNMLDDAERRDYSSILQAGATWITVREIQSEVESLVKSKEGQKPYLRHLDL